MEERKATSVLDHHHVDELVDDEDQSFPGFRFHPTDEELVGFYLRRKVEKKRLRIDIIKQIDIYKYDPWDLSHLSTIGVGDKEWYFFCLRGRKYRNSVRPNRVTGSGFWKATGIDKKICSPSGSNNCIGLKKSLVYYVGSAGKGNKTDWMMHEFRLPPNSSSGNPLHSDEAHEVENWTICRIFKRNASSQKKSNTQTWKNSSSSHQSPTSTTDYASPNSSCIIDTCMDHLLGEYDHNQFGSSTGLLLQSNEEDLQEALRGCNNYQMEDQWINYHVTAAISAGDDDHVPLMEGDSELSSRTHHSTGFDELDDTNWDEIKRILEFSTDPAEVYLKF